MAGLAAVAYPMLGFKFRVKGYRATSHSLMGWPTEMSNNEQFRYGGGRVCIYIVKIFSAESLKGI